ncbi:hypothetical protein [Vallitalea guaymasensis]|nr:hypothetical protein [Vallitalea guaymasensis]
MANGRLEGIGGIFRQLIKRPCSLNNKKTSSLIIISDSPVGLPD